MQQVVKSLFFGFVSVAFLLLGRVSFAVTLVASEYPTMVDSKGEASRYKAIVSEAFSRINQPLTINVMRQAFVGSALTAERADGELMFLSLNEQNANMLISAPYVPVQLHLASRYPSVTDVSEFYHIEDARVATENRFANSRALRLERTVKWSRNPTVFDVFRQIGDERSDYLFADKLLISEFNQVLKEANRAPLNLSRMPLINASMHISLRANVADGKQILSEFNDAISDMQIDGTYNQLVKVNWLSKDVNSDGVADYITSSSNHHDDLSENALRGTLALDDSTPSSQSLFYVDGQAYDSFSAAKAKLSQTPTRASLLDEARYSRMMRDW